PEVRAIDRADRLGQLVERQLHVFRGAGRLGGAARPQPVGAHVALEDPLRRAGELHAGSFYHRERAKIGAPWSFPGPSASASSAVSARAGWASSTRPSTPSATSTSRSRPSAASRPTAC